MYSGRDSEHLFIRYKAEAIPQGESMQDFCLKNKVPYNLFRNGEYCVQVYEEVKYYPQSILHSR